MRHLRTLFKTYIQDKSLVLPKDQSIKPLWKIVQDHLGLQPSSVIEQDMNRILGGCHPLLMEWELYEHMLALHMVGEEILIL